MLKSIFNKKNLTKIVIIFTIGLSSRMIINNYFNINVFTDLFNSISLIYYFIFACVTVSVHYLVDNFNLSLFPNIFQKLSINFNFMKNIKLKYYSINEIKQISRDYFNTTAERDKLLLTNSNETKNIEKIEEIKNSNINNADYGSQETENTKKSKGKRPRHYNNSETTSTHSSSSDKSIRRIQKNSSLSNSYNEQEKSHKPKKKSLKVSEIWGDYNTNNKTNSIFNPKDNSENLNDTNSVYYFKPSDLGYVSSPQTPATSSRYPSTVYTTASCVNPNIYRDESGNYYTINEFGFRNYNVAHPNTQNPIDPLVVPRNSRPSTRKGSFDTPSTMTPLFSQSEQFSNHSNQNLNTEDNRYSSYTNDTNHATVGYNDEPVQSVNWSERRHKVERGVLLKAAEDQALVLTKHEIDLPTKSSRGKFSLGFKLLDNSLNKIDSVYVKYHDITKRKLIWKLWEKDHGEFATYEDFKAEFNPNTSIWKKIKDATKKDVSTEVGNLIKLKNPFNTGLDKNNIKAIGVSSTQDQLNNMNANRYNTEEIKDKKIKHRHIKKK